MYSAPAKLTASLEQRAPRQWSAIVITGIILLSIVLITYWSWLQAHNADLRRASAEAETMSYQLAGRTTQLISRIDQVGTLALKSSRMPPLADLLLDSSEQSVVIVIDSLGKVTDSTLLPVGTDLSATRMYSVAKSLSAGRITIGNPIRLDATSAPVVPVVRAIRDSNNAFKGALVIAPYMSYLTQQSVVPKHPQALFVLITDDGQVLSGSVANRAIDLVKIPEGLWASLKQHNASLKGVLPILKGPLDNEERLLAVASVGAHGLKVAVGLPLSSVVAELNDVFNVVESVVSLLLLGVLFASLGFQRQNRHLREALNNRSEAEGALRQEKDFLDVTLGSIDDGVITIDQHQRITFMNHRAEMMTGCSASEVVGRPVLDVVQMTRSVPDDRNVESTVATIEALPVQSQGIAEIRSTMGGRVTVEYLVTPLEHRHTHCVLVLHDVSRATQMAHKMAYQATHDALTGLVNRAAFDDKLDIILSTIEMDARNHVVLFLDLDQFKVVNDSCGHAAGDELLKQVAFLFGQVLRPHDILARTGGDEFAVLLQDCPARGAMAVAEKLRLQLYSFRFVWNDKSFQVGVSIGAVTVSAGCGSRDELMRKADTACYIAKDSGRNRAHLYLDSDAAVMERQGELSWATRLQKALANDDFELQGQRIASVSANKGHYFEMLVRLREADGQLVPPMAFLPAAERYGLMPALDRAVIAKAMAMHTELQDVSKEPVKFAINLSGASLSDPQLLAYIERTMLQYKVPPAQICFEITETMAIANLPLAVSLMSGLKLLGCHLALDDFGSGMSSFSYLKKLPVDIVKIDGSFVRNMLQNPVDFAMVEAVNHIAHRMGLQTLAEYAESPELITALSEMGIDMLQGYGVGKPRSLKDLKRDVSDNAFRI